MGRYFNTTQKTIKHLEHDYIEDKCFIEYTDGTRQTITLKELGYRLRTFTGFEISLVTASAFVKFTPAVIGGGDPGGGGTDPGGGTGEVHNFVADQSTGILVIDGAGIAPGDVVTVDKGALADFRCIHIHDLQGADGNRIHVRAKDGQQITFNNAAWVLADNYGTALKFERCRYFDVYGTQAAPIVSTGATTADQHAFFHFQFLEKTDNFKFQHWRSINGGTPCQWKTFVTDDTSTHRGTGANLGNIEVCNYEIVDAKNEGIYGGDTAIFYRNLGGGNWTVHQPSSVSDPLPDTADKFKKPLLYVGVKVHSGTINGCGNDGLQFANCTNLEVYNNIVSNWATNNAEGHKAGILIGGGCRLSNVHDNIAWNAANGEGIWHFAEGAGHVVTNNLVYNINGQFVFIKGGEYSVPDSDYHTVYSYNTFAKQQAWATGIRNNGIMGGTAQQTFRNNIIAEPGHGGFGAGNYLYFYNEGGGACIEGTGADANAKFETVAAADLDTENYLLPNVGSTVTDEGYRREA